ncbi:MAG TPA: hypothetical protein VFO34_03380 [Candidatus Acidoferrales bacterium]|nr:hypothetical protein [Candidatus Acidoferrales bacterium]
MSDLAGYAEAGGARGGERRVLQQEAAIGAVSGAVHEERTGTGNCKGAIAVTIGRWTVWQI